MTVEGRKEEERFWEERRHSASLPHSGSNACPPAQHHVPAVSCCFPGNPVMLQHLRRRLIAAPWLRRRDPAAASPGPDPRTWGHRRWCHKGAVLMSHRLLEAAVSVTVCQQLLRGPKWWTIIFRILLFLLQSVIALSCEGLWFYLFTFFFFGRDFAMVQESKWNGTTYVECEYVDQLS